MSLRILACGLPFLSLSSVLSGYFTACGRVWKSALVHLIEQLSYVALVALFLYHAPDGDIERMFNEQLRRLDTVGGQRSRGLRRYPGHGDAAHQLPGEPAHGGVRADSA